MFVISASIMITAVADGLMAMPGALTPSEAVTAYNAGASYVKLFPIGVLGPEYVKAVMAPLSHIPFLAVGGNLTNKEWIANGEWDKITATAAQLVKNSNIQA